jgi:GTP-binding protein
MAWKGPVFEISALNREGCQELINAIYLHLEEKRAQDVRVDETMQMTEEARGIVSIDPDDPRFKILED